MTHWPEKDITPVPYDPSIWRSTIQDYPAMADFLADCLPHEGITRIGDGDGRVEFMARKLGETGLADSAFFMVGFSGAMPSRSELIAPFFSGVAMAARLRLSLLAFADPVISNHRDVTLAWYAGGAKSTDHPENVAQVIDQISQKTGRIPLMIGGSGGGFTAMNVLRHMKTPGRAVIWNPQTLISAYDEKTVRTYLAAAFPDQTFPDHGDLHGALEAVGVRQDVRSASFPSGSCVLYLQNDSDSHVQAHLEPFLQYGIWQKHSASTWASPDRRVVVWMGNWGYGHAVPPHALIDAAIAMIVRDEGQDDPMGCLPAAVATLADTLDVVSETPPQFDVDAFATLEGNKIRVSLKGPMLTGDLNVAFYLMEQGVRVAHRWYGTRNEVEFEIGQTSPVSLSVIVFLRYGQGKPHITTIPVTLKPPL